MSPILSSLGAQREGGIQGAGGSVRVRQLAERCTPDTREAIEGERTREAGRTGSDQVISETSEVLMQRDPLRLMSPLRQTRFLPSRLACKRAWSAAETISVRLGDEPGGM